MPIQSAQVLLRHCQRVERSDARGLLTLLHRKVFAQAPGNRQLPANDRERSAQEKQIPGIGRLDVSPQRCRRRG
jgi:hypothetical protein